VEGFFPFQNMHLKDIYAGEVGKIVLKAVIWNQHSVSVCR
jgi:hypothetical protein